MKNCFFIITTLSALLTAEGMPGICIWDQKVHNVNNVELTISNYGMTGPGYWPKGSGHNYLFGAGLWFGSVDTVSSYNKWDTLVTIGYGPHGGESEFAPGLRGSDPSAPLNRIYMFPDPWPAPAESFPMAPQDTVSHQDSWCCYNDCDSAYHMPGDTRPIGIEVYQTGYEWQRTQVADFFFMTYEFKNVSGHDLTQCYIGIATDCDIGNESGAGNDIMAGIVKRNYNIGGVIYRVDNIAYQWQETEESGWTPPVPGVIGFDLLQTPFDLVPGQDKDQDGIPDQYERDSAYYAQNVPPSQWDADTDYVPDWRDASENPQKGMTALKRFTLNLEPNRDPERYLTLAGYNFQTGAYEPYDTVPPAPDDQRFLMASGPLTILPDSVETFIFAVMFANWAGIYGAPDTALALVDYWAQRYYDMSWFRYTGIEESHSRSVNGEEARVVPNPISQNGTLSFFVPKPGWVKVELYNAAGQRVRELFRENRLRGRCSLRFNTNGLSAGTFFLVIDANGVCASQRLVIVH
jgi:hypothetical protein